MNGRQPTRVLAFPGACEPSRHVGLRAFGPALTLPKERGVYRCSGLVMGMVTYFAITSVGELAGDEMLSVQPGEVSEARAMSALRNSLRAAEEPWSRPSLALVKVQS